MFPDYHVHLENGPFSLEWALRFVEEAGRKKVCEIGFVEHGHRFLEAGHLLEIDWAEQYCTERTMDFVNLIERMKVEGYPVKLGIEMDFLLGKEEAIGKYLRDYPWDFVIGSVHWDILPDSSGFAFDDLESQWTQEEIPSIYHRYFRLVEEAVSSGLFDILGHVDVVKASGQQPRDTYDPLLEAVFDRLSETGMCLEVSTAGLRKPVGEIYPPERFLSYACETGIPVVTSSDAHDPGDTGFMIEEMAGSLLKAGYKTLSTFDRRRRSEILMKTQE